jgi:hypothetical protein
MLGSAQEARTETIQKTVIETPLAAAEVLEHILRAGCGDVSRSGKALRTR